MKNNNLYSLGISTILFFAAILAYNLFEPLINGQKSSVPQQEISTSGGQEYTRAAVGMGDLHLYEASLQSRAGEVQEKCHRAVGMGDLRSYEAQQSAMNLWALKNGNLAINMADLRRYEALQVAPQVRDECEPAT